MNRIDRLPDFFIAGGPRSGTTTLSRCLAKHPEVCFSRPKELHYFSRLTHDPSGNEIESDYLGRYFRHYRGDERAVGEGSVSYLYSADALRRITSLAPQAKFIALVRNPLHMLPSYHLRMLFVTVEEVEDFRTAWFLQEARLRGERIPRGCIDARLLQYREVARFGNQIERLYRLAGRERALVLVFEDFKRDPRSEYLRVLDFIGVGDDGRSVFPTKLPSRTYRHRWIQEILYRQRPGIEGAVETLQRRARKKKAKGGKPLLKRLARWNTIEARPAPLDAEMRAVLRETFAPDVEKLSHLLDRDLGHWLTPPALREEPAPIAGAAQVADQAVADGLALSSTSLAISSSR